MLHLIWEHPHRLVGGLGMAANSLSDALKKREGIKVRVMTPSAMMNENSFIKNTYQLDIGIQEALLLQKRVENKQDLMGINGVVASFAEKISAACVNDLELAGCKIVHAHDWMTAAAGVSVQRSLGVPLILHVHSTHVDREGAHAKGAVFLHEKWAMQQADVVIAVSDYTKRVIEKYYDISPEKIRVVRNAINVDEGDDSSGKNVHFHKEPVVMFAGRLVAQKHPEAAVEIMAGALKKLEHARGVIAGGGEKLEVIRELVKFKGMESRIEVLGHVPQKNMHAIYASASVLIMPSISEPFGLVAVEAARAGVAVMMSDRCGASEVLKSARVIGLYQTHDWIDSVVELMENKDIREAQVRKQEDEIEAYQWSDAGAEVMKIVYELLGKRA
jgi:glycogen synthase